MKAGSKRTSHNGKFSSIGLQAHTFPLCWSSEIHTRDCGAYPDVVCHVPLSVNKTRYELPANSHVTYQ